MDRMFRRKLTDQLLLFVDPFFKFRLRENIRIVIKNRNLKIFRQIFQHITAAWCTTAVKEQSWNLLFRYDQFYLFIQFFLVILFLHLFISPHIADLFLIIVQLFSSHNIFSALFFFFRSIPARCTHAFFYFS